MTDATLPVEGEIQTRPETAGYVFNHTMLRIKDPARSLPFYSDLLGMSLIRKLDFPDAKFSLYFLGHVEAGDAPLPTDNTERSAWMFRQSGLLELTHNWGTEDEPGEPYHDGNSDPRGFGHIGITVPDVDVACARFEAAGASFVKRPNEGGIKGIAFVRDPDGYWVEILPHAPIPGVN